MCYVISKFLMLLFITVMFTMCGYFITKYLLDCRRRSMKNYKKVNTCDCDCEFNCPCSFEIHFGDQRLVMTVDDIIEQHKTFILEKKQLRKSRSFSNIFWKDFSSNTDNFWFWVVLPIFPIIASVLMIATSLILCKGQCDDGCAYCISSSILCIVCETDMTCLMSMFFSIVLIPMSLTIHESENNLKIFIFNVFMLNCNLITLKMYHWHPVLIFYFVIVYAAAFISMFKKPLVKWLNNR